MVRWTFLRSFPVNENWGSVVSWQPFSPLDAEAVRLEEGVLTRINIRFTDHVGRPLPMDNTSHTFIQLTLLQLPTM
jgi:hypothetical protein